MRRVVAALAITAMVVAVAAGSTTTAQTVGVPIIGAKVSRSYNTLNQHLWKPLTFDVERWDQGGFYNPTQPDRLTITVAGCYYVEAQITVLGSAYNLAGQWADGNPPSPDFIIEVRRNGDPFDYVTASRLSNENPGVAQLNTTQTVECFTAGDYIQVFVTANRVIESNWPDTDGSVSPVLLVAYLGSLTPAPP